MIVFDYKLKKLTEIQPQDYDLCKHLKTSEMSQKQRRAVIGQYIKVAPDLVNYLRIHTTNRVVAVNQAMTQMVKGILPLNLVVLMVLLEDVVKEMRFRTR